MRQHRIGCQFFFIAVAINQFGRIAFAKDESDKMIVTRAGDPCRNVAPSMIVPFCAEPLAAADASKRDLLKMTYHSQGSNKGTVIIVKPEQ
ncbi:hypothetical protein [Rhizobium leguminosarum]|uniref:hypothetical protein n=1 Tax=Rhizobium leguminosarum TaxID=384 RepID=UPI001FE127BC|nr:hypothetical protein [Rhizobium leguminosarum]